MKSMKNCALIGAICLLLVSCNGYEKLLNSNDYDAKYEAAMRYYNNNSYSRAIQLFENLTLHYRGREHAEQVAWCYAQALYKEHDYYTAAYQFKRYASQYPYGDNAEEALYMSAYCKYLYSPDYYLDQTPTADAIQELEAFAERYPRSVHMPDVNRQLDEMRAKLVKKDYEKAFGWYTIEEYHAAYESFRQFLDLYPEAAQREEAMYLQLDAAYRYAMGSRLDRQRERLHQTLVDFDRFVANYPESRHLADAQAIYTKARAALTTLEKGEASAKTAAQ